MKFKVEDIQGRHIVIAGILLYLLSFFVGLGFTGTAIEEPGEMKDAGFLKATANTVTDTSRDACLQAISENSGSKSDVVALKASKIYVSAPMGNECARKISKRNISDSSDKSIVTEVSERDATESSCDEIISDVSEINGSDSSGVVTIRDVSENDSALSKGACIPKASEMVVPVAYLKKIFLNNLGLNAIIILGAFSLLTFSLIVLIFNALHVGLLLKGIYTSYGFRLAASLIMPHLVVEVVSHILSLYLAYLILKRIIVPVILKGEGIDSHSFRSSQILALFSLVILITFLGALIEIYVTPKLI